MAWDGKLDVLVIGGGMISQEVILPTVFQERRRGKVGRVLVSSLSGDINQQVRAALPGEAFSAYPDPDKVDPKKPFPELFRQALADLGEKGIVIVATPDHLHTPMVLAALKAGYDVSCMKPLCLKVVEAHEIDEKAAERARYVLTDYHKRHDRAVRAARYRYRRGDLGEMLHGHAWIEEPKYMPLDKFKRWAAESSPFEYVGVHYVDVYYFVTGLTPKRLVAFGQKKYLPTQGSDAFDAVQATIEWEDGSVLWVQTSWVLSAKGSAMTRQGLNLVGTMGEYWADHMNRNLHFVTEEKGFEHYNPNFFKAFDSWEGEGLVDQVGYGYESVQQALDDVRFILKETDGLPESRAVARRRQILQGWKDLRALPHQALIGVAVNEAVRLSIEHGSAWVGFDAQMYPKLC